MEKLTCYKVAMAEEQMMWNVKDNFLSDHLYAFAPTSDPPHM